MASVNNSTTGNIITIDAASYNPNINTETDKNTVNIEENLLVNVYY